MLYNKFKLTKGNSLNQIQHEKNILNIIKFAPIILVIILSFVFTNIFITQKKELLLEEKIKLEEKYIQENKKRIKFLTNKVFAIIEEEKNNSESALKEMIKNKVYEAHRVATNLYNLEKSTPHPHILQSVKEALRAMTFYDGRGYIFMDDINGVKLLNPIKEIEGKNFLNFKDPKGYQFVKKIVDTIENKTETFDVYHWYKGLDRTKSYRKISFYKYFEPLNAAIGTGDYLEDFEENLKKRILSKINHMKFENYEHVFIFNLDGEVLSYPKVELVGTNRFEATNKTGEHILKNLIEFAQKNKEGFIEYNASIKINEDLKSNEKISYIKLFKQWNWLVGSGFFLEGLNDELEQREKALVKSNDEVIEDIIKTSALITFILIIFSFYISKIIAKMFKNYKDNIQVEIKKTLEKEKLLLQQSKMATMGEMIGSIAHQWKQPLGIISVSNGILRFAKEEEGLISTEKHAQALDNVDYAVENLSQTIDDFRNFFNPNKAREFFKISHSIEDTLKLISFELKNSNIEIIENIQDIEVFNSQNELQQTLINLLKNAKEELIKKGNDEKKLIFITVEPEEKNVIIKITDNASGISEEIIEKIFDAYFTTKGEDGGTGIGLYMCKQIIQESMKGKLTVANVEYQYENKTYTGAEFTVSIPIDYRQ